jgi:hypothetical protein
MIITITYAIIAGEGRGPLAPSPVPLGVMTFGANVAALDWIHCLLMSIDPHKIPIVDNAFQKTSWPLAIFPPDKICVSVNGNALPNLNYIRTFGRRFNPSVGWRGHCEIPDRCTKSDMSTSFPDDFDGHHSSDFLHKVAFLSNYVYTPHTPYSRTILIDAFLWNITK